MTFVQSEENNSFFYLFWGVLFALLVIEVISLVVLYNRILSLRVALNDTKTHIQNIETQSSELKDRIFKLTASVNLRAVALNRNLIEEKNPEYFELGRTWGEFVSRY